MKSISLITKRKIEAKTVSREIIDLFPFSKETTTNDEKELFLGKFPNEFYILFADSMNVEDEDSMFTEEERNLIGFKPAVFTNLYFHIDGVALSPVAVILKHYPELIIYDEQEDVFLPASEYLAKVENKKSIKR